MSNNKFRSDAYYSATSLSSVPKIVDEINRPEADFEHHEVNRERNAQADAAVTFLYAVIGLGILAFLYWQQASPWVSLGGMIVWLVFAIFGTQLITSGTIAYWIHEKYKFKSTKYKTDALVELAHRHFDLLTGHEPDPLPALPQTPHAPDSLTNYVPATPPAPPPPTYTGQEIAHAIRWARGLYGPDSYLDFDEGVTKSGKVRGEVIGSKRGGGSPRSKEYLYDRGFLEARPGGDWVNMDAFPTVVELDKLSADVVTWTRG